MTVTDDLIEGRLDHLPADKVAEVRALVNDRSLGPDDREARARSVVAGDTESSAAAGKVGSVVALPDRRYEPTEHGLMRRLIDAHGDDLAYVADTGRWHVWDGRRWAHDVTGQRHRLLRGVVEDVGADVVAERDATRRRDLFRHFEAAQTARFEKAVFEMAETDAKVVCTVDQLDRDAWALNIKNGTLDLRTGELRPHRREELLTRLAPVDYDPDAQCPTWDWFVEWVTCGDADLATYLQRAVGYSMTGDVTEQCVFFAHGGGANGKSTFLGTIEAMLGLGDDGHALAAAPTLLVASRNAEHPTVVADLVGRRLVVCQEIEEGARLDEVRVKSLSGGDAIKARFMRRDYFTFQPSGKLWLGANHKPRVRGTDHAIWRRMRLIPFAATVADADRDPHLPDRIRAELPGVLAWAVRGCLDWQKDGIDAPAAVTTATDDYRASQDIVAGWLDECCIIDPTSAATPKSLFDSYTSWCDANRERPLSQKALAQHLYAKGLDREDRTSRAKWLGIGVITTTDTGDR